MNREETKQAIAIMQAFVDGKEIEYSDGTVWESGFSPSWNWYGTKYRIKPKPREFWVAGPVMFHKEADAIKYANGGEVIHVREVKD